MNCIDLTCPVELFSAALPTEELPAATLTLFNLSDRVIASAEVLLRLLDEDGAETERLSFRGRALNGRPHSTFLLTVPCAASPELKSLDVSVEKVWYTDNDTWRRDPARVVAYTPNALPVSPALTNLKYAAGETAVGFPSLQNGLWVCVCGRPNPEGEAFCARCGRQKELVFSRFSPETVEAQVSMKTRQLDLNSRNMREDTIRLQRLREEEYNRKKARRRTRLGIAGALLLSLALTAAAVRFGAPALSLAAGRKALENGDPAGAKAVLEPLGSFGNAKELLSECDWQLALQAAERSETPEEMAAAAALLRSVKDRPEAAAKADETDLLRARLLLARGQWQDALDVLAAVPDSEARTELEQDCLAAQAYALQQAGKNEEARKIWLQLGDRPGAKEQAALCVYEPALALMDAGEWDQAVALLSQIPDYADSREKTLECHYRKAEKLLADGDPAGASDEFLLAGGWSDAPERTRALTYGRAEALYAEGNYRDAQPLYASIPDYLDANDKTRACSYALAKAAADDLEYTLALELLKDVPDDFPGAGELRAEASYHKAKSAVNREEWAEAAALLGGIDRQSLLGKYRDIENLYLRACEKAGIEPYPEETAAPEEIPSPSPTPATASPLDAFKVTDEDEQP